MDRMACVDIPSLPLQILLRVHPDWRELPVAVVDRDKPQGIVQQVNKHARAYRIFPGMRYAAGLSLATNLCAGVVAEEEIAAAVAFIAKRLWRFSPRIEPASREPGVFWLDASGLEHLYNSIENWLESLRADLAQAGFHASAAVGFSRFGSYVAARSSRKPIVFACAGDEQRHLRAVRIDRLGVAPNLRDALGKLGIDTLGGFIDLPATGIRKRFGIEAEDLHRRAKGEGWAPLVPKTFLDPLVRRFFFDYPETNRERALFAIEPLLRSLLAMLAERREAMASLTLALRFHDGGTCRESLSPAAPTLDESQILPLIRLRLETISLPSGAVELTLGATGAPADQRQLELFCDRSGRTAEAVDRAFARLRAELGNDAVVVARLQAGHLPEASFCWERLARLERPAPAEAGTRPLVRRFYSPPRPLPPRARHEPDGWLVVSGVDGPVDEVIGPHMMTGGWWRREVSRVYHYVRTRSGRWLWIYHDRCRRRWFLQGEVE